MSYKIGDALTELKKLESCRFYTCVTSPPYWGLRDYGVEGQLGLERSPAEYVEKLVEVFRQVRRVLREDGTLWLNLGDSYNGGGTHHGEKNQGMSQSKKRQGSEWTTRVPGLKPKDLVGIPWRVAFALQSDGWYLRSDIIWSKPNPMPESVLDRPTKSHEYIFLLSKSERYFYDYKAIKEKAVEARSGNSVRRMPSEYDRPEDHRGASIPWTNSDGRNRRSVWTVTTKPFSGAHFATFPEELIKPCILAGAPEGGEVLDPFLGSGTVGRVAEDLGREWFGIELNPKYETLIKKRTAQIGLFGGTRKENPRPRLRAGAKPKIGD